MAYKIISIIPHPPAYELYKDNRPTINWGTPTGTWVGIWGTDIPNQFANEIVKLTTEFNIEIWQPDLRADKIYSFKFENGIVHRLFPAKVVKKLIGFKFNCGVESSLIIHEIEKNRKVPLLLHLHSLGYRINQAIYKQMPEIPKVINFHSLITSNPNIEMRKIRKNLAANLFYFQQNIILKKNKKIFFTYNNSHDIEELKKYKPEGIERIFTGCDFSFWKDFNKELAKKRLGISKQKKVISMASRLVPLKQVDKIIQILIEIEKASDIDFTLIIAGHGTYDYEKYLQHISIKLSNNNKILFVGFLNDNRMRNLYNASDLFISASIAEGGPTSVIKAIACETPVMCTRVQGIDDYLNEEDAGIIVDKYDYNNWRKKIFQVLNGENSAKIFPRDKAKQLFHWPNVANKYIQIYRKLMNSSL